MTTRRLWLPLLLVGLHTLSGVAQAQDSQETQDLNMRAYIELMRSDLRANKSNVIAKVMQFSEEDAAKFWPIYREYELELARLGDLRLKIIEDYTANYDTLTDKVADDLVHRALDFEAQRNKLKRKYYEKVKIALTPIVAARFYQVEHQILLLIDLQIASSLPVVSKEQENQ